jgi:predicted transcriptional regulator of viral defense system
MDISKRQTVINYVRQKSLVRPIELEEQGLPRTYLYQLAKEGVILHAGRGLYQWPDIIPDIHIALSEIAKKVPKGVIALLSALSFHEFTSQNPFEVWMALERQSWKPVIDYPPTRFVFMSGRSIQEGIDRHVINGVDVRIFNPAKTVADCFKYRNKIGLDVALEALKENWRMKRFTLDELMHYAEICRVKNVIRPYVEALV